MNSLSRTDVSPGGLHSEAAANSTKDMFGKMRLSSEPETKCCNCGGACPQQDEQVRAELDRVREELAAERQHHMSTLKKLAKSEDELFSAKRQLQQYQETQMDDIVRRRLEAMNFYREKYEREQLIKQHQMPWQTASHQAMVTVGGSDLLEDGEGRDTIDPPIPPRNFVNEPARNYDVLAPISSYVPVNSEDGDVQQQGAGSSQNQSGQRAKRLHLDEDDPDENEASSALHCPHCNRPFPLSETAAFLAHVEACVD